LLALLLREREDIRLSPETVRRGLHRMAFVWRRPRPVVGPRDPEHGTKLRQIQRFIARLPHNETVVFQDEVDVHLNPKIGSCWMVRGEQAEVVTPGNKENGIWRRRCTGGPAVGSRATPQRGIIHRPSR
jgi:putative transposase